MLAGCKPHTSNASYLKFRGQQSLHQEGALVVLCMVCNWFYMK